MEVNVLFSAAERVSKNSYKTVGNSRAVSFAAIDDELESAKLRVEKAISSVFSGPLEWRKDIGVFPVR
jgi:phosphoribosylamine-glycine ligase